MSDMGGKELGYRAVTHRAPGLNLVLRLYNLVRNGNQLTARRVLV